MANDRDREQWVDNDEYLYNWARRWIRQNTGKGGMRGFIRAHRAELDSIINKTVNGDRQAHTKQGYNPGLNSRGLANHTNPFGSW